MPKIKKTVGLGLSGKHRDLLDYIFEKLLSHEEEKLIMSDYELKKNTGISNTTIWQFKNKVKEIKPFGLDWKTGTYGTSTTEYFLEEI